MGKSSNKILLGVLIGIILMLIIVFGLFVTGTINFTSNDGKVIDNNTGTSNSIKIDESKAYVYNAQYQANTEYQQYGKAYNNEFATRTTDDGFDTIIVNDGVLKLKDLVVPYININTAEVSVINNDLKKLYDEYVQKYDESATAYNKIVRKYGADFSVNDVTFDSVYDRWAYPMLKYYTYQYNNILSIVVTYGVLGTDILHPEYLVYNIDLTNGKLLNYSQFLSKFNLNTNNATSQIVEQVTKYVKASEDYISSRLNDTIENLKKSINDSTVLYFVDNQGNINYIVNIFMEAGSGQYPRKINVIK